MDDGRRTEEAEGRPVLYCIYDYCTNGEICFCKKRPFDEMNGNKGIPTSHFVIGSISAGCFSTLLGHPLDTIKVHQQTRHNNNNNRQFSINNKHAKTNYNSFQVANELTKGGKNVFRLFKGIGPPMANQMIMNTIMFSVFYNVKDKMMSSQHHLDENSTALLAGLFSGFATACVSTPTDWIKIQAQLSLLTTSSSSSSSMREQQQQQGSNIKSNNKTDVRSIFRQIFFNNKTGQLQIYQGIRILYRGHVANLCREGVFTMVYLGLYDRIMSKVCDGNANKNTTAISGARNNNMGTVVLVSSFTGACAWICNYPFDTIKSVIQAQGAAGKTITMRSAMRSIYKSGGWKAFFRGAGSSTFRAMLVTSSRMLAYEKTIQLIS